MTARPALVALGVASTLSAVFGVLLLVDSVAPDEIGHPWTALQPEAATALVCWFVAAVLGVGILGLRTASSRRGSGDDIVVDGLAWAAAAVLLVPFTFLLLSEIAGHPRLFLICVPSTAFGLWAMARTQRHYRMPTRVSLAGFAWGASIAVGFGNLVNGLTAAFAQGYILHPSEVLDRVDPDALPDLAHVNDLAARNARVMSLLLPLSAGIFEELGKAAGIAIVCVLCRRWIHGIGSGVVIGAAVGLGFNLVETIDYMSSAAQFQYWMRQSVGLLAGHVAFTAMVGAAFGAARGLDRHGALRLIGLGFGVAVAAHFGTDALLPYLGRVQQKWFDPGPTVTALFFQPLDVVLLEGPFVLMYVLALRRGRREETDVLTRELHAEARTGHGAVTSAEVPVLLDPITRLTHRIWAFRSGAGIEGFRHVGLLQNAQLDLALQRSHATGAEQEYSETLIHALRQRIRHLRAEPPTALRQTTIAAAEPGA